MVLMVEWILWHFQLGNLAANLFRREDYWEGKKRNNKTYPFFWSVLLIWPPVSVTLGISLCSVCQ